MTASRLSQRFGTLPRPAWLPAATWPFETYGVEAGDSLFAVTEAGAGPPLLLVHVGAWSFIWRDLVLRLARDFRCVFFDAPGNGRTRDAPGTTITMENAARAVRSVVDALDLRKFTLVAHDLGGPAALAALATTPERVAGIVAMNTFAWSPSGGLRKMLAIMGSPVMREIDVATGFLPRISATWFGVGRHMDQASRAAFRAGMGPLGRRAFHHYMRDVRQCEGLHEKVQRALEGPLANAPLLTVFGERNDPFGFQPRWKQMFPGARQVVVAKGNHFPMCDAPDFVADAIRHWYRERVAYP